MTNKIASVVGAIFLFGVAASWADPPAESGNVERFPVFAGFILWDPDTNRLAIVGDDPTATCAGDFQVDLWTLQRVSEDPSTPEELGERIIHRIFGDQIKVSIFEDIYEDPGDFVGICQAISGLEPFKGVGKSNGNENDFMRPFDCAFAPELVGKNAHTIHLSAHGRGEGPFGTRGRYSISAGFSRKGCDAPTSYRTHIRLH